MDKQTPHSDWKYGDVICDLYDGWDLSKLGPDYVITDKVSIPTSKGSSFIEDTIREQTGDDAYQYTNKYLVVIGEYAEGLILAASYDATVLITVNVRTPN